jgi:hypothetical protein
MTFTFENIKKAVDGLRADLGKGFIQTDIWNTTTLKSVIHTHSAGMLPVYGMVPKYIKKFSEVSGLLIKTLQESGLTELGNYYLVNLEDNKVVMILCYRSGEEKRDITYQQYILADMDHTTIGALLGIAIPNMLRSIGS